MRGLEVLVAVLVARCVAIELTKEMANDMKFRQDPKAIKPRSADNVKVRARCHPVPLTPMGEKLRAANRPIVILVQTLIATKSNICEGSRTDWRDGLGQCMALITGLRVIVRQDDGTCSDCSTLQRTSCSSLTENPPAMVMVLGGGEDPGMVFRCSNTYCGKRYLEPATFSINSGQFGPDDYFGGCVVQALSRHGEPLLNPRLVDATADPPTRLLWFPMLNPHAEIRVLWERATLFANRTVDLSDTTTLPTFAHSSADYTPFNLNYVGPEISDFDYMKHVVEPTMAHSKLYTKIEIIRDDSLPKPLLLPSVRENKDLESEYEMRQRVLRDTNEPRGRALLYIGSYRPSKGQLKFLTRLKRASLGIFHVEMYGVRQTGMGKVSDDWDAVELEANGEKLAGKVQMNGERIHHLHLMMKMTKAAGLVHYSGGDRNPRVLYEALFFGCPVFVTQQSMPYIGLQCHRFVGLTDADADADTLNADLRAWTRRLEQNERDKNSTTGAVSLQQGILEFVERELTPQRVYIGLCERFGLCAIKPSSGKKPSELRHIQASFPWTRTHHCRNRALRRFENWRDSNQSASYLTKRFLAIKQNAECNSYHPAQNCQNKCHDDNKAELLAHPPRQWWDSRGLSPFRAEPPPTWLGMLTKPKAPLWDIEMGLQRAKADKIVKEKHYKRVARLARYAALNEVPPPGDDDEVQQTAPRPLAR